MINYKKQLYLILLFFSTLSWGQTGINTRSPDASAALDIYSVDKGVLLPQYTLGSLTDAANPVAGPVEGALIYNRGGINPKGNYYWTGSLWERLIIKGETDQILNIKLAAFKPTSGATSVTLIPNGITTNNIVTFPAAYTTVINNIEGVNYTSGSSIDLLRGSYRVDITFDCMSPNSINSADFDPVGDNELFVVNAGIVNSSNILISDLKVASTIAKYGGTGSVQGYRFSYFVTLASDQPVKIMLNHNNGASDSTLTRDNQAGLIVTITKFFE